MNITYKPVIGLNSFSFVEYHPELETEESGLEIFQRIRDVVMRELEFIERDTGRSWSAEHARS